MACNGDCKCRGEAASPRHPLPEAFILQTIIGPQIVLGTIPETKEGDLCRAGLARLAEDNDFWLKLWDIGVNDAQLKLGMFPLKGKHGCR